MATTFSEALREALAALGGVRNKAEIGAWINAHYPDRWKQGTLDGHVYGCSINNPKGIQHHPSFHRFLFMHGNGRYELYDPATHGNYENGFPAGENVAVSLPESDNISDNASTTFAYEEHLQDYLERNLPILEVGLTLWNGAASVEYNIEGRRIDILARDKNGIPVVVELKVARGHEKVIGQCLYYRGKVKDLLKVERVRIFIVAEEISPELKIAAREAGSDVTLFEYSLSMTVRPVM